VGLATAGLGAILAWRKHEASDVVGALGVVCVFVAAFLGSLLQLGVLRHD
jgi:hypothetical protein